MAGQIDITEAGRLGAPGRLSLVQDFANARLAKSQEPAGKDRRVTVLAWLREAGVTSARSIAPEDVKRLLLFRHLIRRAIEANHDDADMLFADIRRLNKVLAAGILRVEIADEGKPALTGAATGVDGIIATFAEVMLEAAQAGDWQRMRLCRADDCRWVFYDRSKNRSGVWCSMSDCGNRAKARAFRERHQAAGKRA